MMGRPITSTNELRPPEADPPDWALAAARAVLRILIPGSEPGPEVLERIAREIARARTAALGRLPGIARRIDTRTRGEELR